MIYNPLQIKNQTHFVMSNQITHLLIVDDDTRIRKLLSKYLVDNGFIVTVAEDACAAREKLNEFIFDLLVVDVMMPGESGVEFTSWLKEQNNDVPVLMLTAMGEAKDRIAGLESGADDYLPKPFEPQELLLRIKRIVNRTRPVEKTKVTFGSLIFDISNMSLQKNGQNIQITSNEAKLLGLLCGNIGKNVSRENMAKLCDGVNERTIDVQIARLRGKIEDNPKKPVHLKSVRGVGYALYS